MDKLNELSQATSEDGSIQFVSICCDKLDGAREIIQCNDIPRWSCIRHFFMDHQHKELAKHLLGFTQVPYYVVFDALGNLVFAGASLPVLDELLGRETANMSTTTFEQKTGASNDALFVDDLDF